MKLLDRNGNQVEVPDDQAQAALVSGQYGAPEGTQIPVSVGGEIGSVPIESLQNALRKGAKVVSQAEYDKADTDARYGDAGHGALAFGTAALDSATLGISNAAIGGLGGKEVRETIRKSQEANPTATGLGEAAGFIAPIAVDALSGGTATPALAALEAERVAAKGGVKLLGAGERARAALKAGEKLLLTEGESVGARAAETLAPLEGVGARAAEGLAPLEGEFLDQAPRGLFRGPEMPGEIVPPPAELPGLPGGARALPETPGLVPTYEGEFINQAPRGLLPGPETLGEAVPSPAGLPGGPRALLPETPGLVPTYEGEFINQAPRGLLPGRETLGEVVPPGLPGGAPPALPGPTGLVPTYEGEFIDRAARAALPGPEMLGEAISPEARRVIGTLTPESQRVLEGLSPENTRRVVDAWVRRGRVSPTAAAEWEAIGTHAAQNTGVIGRVMGVVPDATMPQTQAQVAERLQQAANAAAEAMRSGPAIEAAAAQAAGKGLVRQAVESTLLGPTRAVQGLGQAVEDVVRKIVGTEAETALGRIAQKTVIGAARGATEGAIFSAAHEVGQGFLQDNVDLNGERIASAMVHGAMLGGVFGGGISALGQGTKEAVTGAMRKLGGNSDIATKLSEKAGEHIWHAAGPTQKMTAEANRYAGGAWKVGSLAREKAEQLLGRKLRTREDILELAPLLRKDAIKQMDNVIDRLDDVALRKTRIKVEDIDAQLETIQNELRKRAAPTGEIQSFRRRILDATGAWDDTLGAIDPHASVTFRQLRDFRVTVDDMVSNWNAAPGADKAPTVALKQIRSWLEGRVTEAADKVANEAGGTLLRDYKAAKQAYQGGLLLEKAAARGVAANGTNQFLSLTDKMTGHALGGAGALLGGHAGFVAGEALGGLASKVIRSHFDFMVADTLDKLASVARNDHVMQTMQEANARVQKRVDHGLNQVRKAMDGKPVESPPIAGPKTFEERRQQLLNVAAQHEEVLGHLNSVTKPLDKASPDIAASVNTATLRAITFLMDALPKPPPPGPDALTPHLDAKQWQPTPAQKGRFNRQFDLVVRPELMLLLLAQGNLTKDGVDAVKATNPAMFKDAQKKLRNETEHRNKPIAASMRPYARLVFDEPLIDPRRAQSYQAAYGPGPKPQKPGHTIKFADNTSLK